MQSVIHRPKVKRNIREGQQLGENGDMLLNEIISKHYHSGLFSEDMYINSVVHRIRPSDVNLNANKGLLIRIRCKSECE